MTRPVFVLVFAILLAGEAFAKTPDTRVQTLPTPSGTTDLKASTFKTRIQNIPPGTGIAVKIHKGKKLNGRLVSVSSDGFSLQTFDGDKITEKTIPFNQVDRLSGDRTSAKKKEAAWVAGGAAVGGGALVMIILAAIGAL